MFKRVLSLILALMIATSALLLSSCAGGTPINNQGNKLNIELVDPLPRRPLGTNRRRSPQAS